MRKERRRFQDLVFHVDERVLSERNPPAGLSLRVRLHDVATLLTVGEAFVSPEMYNPTERVDMRVEKSWGSLRYLRFTTTEDDETRAFVGRRRRQ